MKTPRFNFPSHVSLPEETRTALVELCNESLASTIDLHSQVKQAHWNIKGAQFFARHELFDALATKLLGWADTLAERGAVLGGYATGTIRLAAERSSLPEYDLNAVDGTTHIRALVDRYAVYTERARAAIAVCAKLDDPASEDLFTEILRGAELDMWFLESHIAA